MRLPLVVQLAAVGEPLTRNVVAKNPVEAGRDEVERIAVDVDLVTMLEVRIGKPKRRKSLSKMKSSLLAARYARRPANATPRSPGSRHDPPSRC